MKMKYTVLSLLFLVGIVKTNAQSLGSNSGYTMDAFDIQGKPFTLKKNSIEGSPMLNEKWGKGLVKFKNGYLVKEAVLQFNLELNELYFRKNEQTYSFLDPVREFILAYEENGVPHSVVFRNGYPAFAKNDTSSFYEVMTDGKKVQFIKYTVKSVAEQYNYGGSGKKYYRVVESWFLFDTEMGKIIKINKNKKDIIEALPNYKSSIESFLKQNNYRLREEDEIAELLGYLNK